MTQRHAVKHIDVAIDPRDVRLKSILIGRLFRTLRTRCEKMRTEENNTNSFIWAYLDKAKFDKRADYTVQQNNKSLSTITVNWCDISRGDYPIVG